jgi:hypothetical protein
MKNFIKFLLIGIIYPIWGRNGVVFIVLSKITQHDALDVFSFIERKFNLISFEELFKKDKIIKRNFKKDIVLIFDDGYSINLDIINSFLEMNLAGQFMMGTQLSTGKSVLFRFEMYRKMTKKNINNNFYHSELILRKIPIKTQKTSFFCL